MRQAHAVDAKDAVVDKTAKTGDLHSLKPCLVI